MFEKEAEKWADEIVEKGCVAIAEDRVRQDIQYTFRKSAEFGFNKRTEETENIFDKISELTDKLYLSGLSEKQIAFIEQIQDLIGR